MPIRPYLSGQAFEPEAIHNMSLALESVCETLGMRMADDPSHQACRSKDYRTSAARRARPGYAPLLPLLTGRNQVANVASLIQRDTLCRAIAAPSCLFSVKICN